MTLLYTKLAKEWRGAIDRIAQRLDYVREIGQFQEKMAQAFYGKRVAIVGNSPGLIGSSMGAEIDAHDIVVRINGRSRIDAPEDLGTKLDVVFLGATIEKESDFDKLDVYKDMGCVAISTTKNRRAIEQIHIADAIFYPALLPRFLSRHMAQQLAVKIGGKRFRPPRSGFICLSAIHSYGQAAQISLYGMSDSLDKSQMRITPTGEVTHYDPQQYQSLHCDPAIELALMRGLATTANRIEWRGRD